MAPPAPAPAAPHAGPHSWMAIVAPYQKARLWREPLGGREHVCALLRLLVPGLLGAGHLLLADPGGVVVAAGFLMRIFIILHDCGHGSFFKSTRANDWVGWSAGVLTLTPYFQWRQRPCHPPRRLGRPRPARRGRCVDTSPSRNTWPCRAGAAWPTGSTATRCPCLASAPCLSLRDRPSLCGRHAPPAAASAECLPDQFRAAGASRCCSAISWLAGACCWCTCPSCSSRRTAGVWLFYVQHQFEDTYWEQPPRLGLRRRRAARQLVLQAAQVLQWFTGNIGLHHIHHLSPTHPQLQPAGAATTPTRSCARSPWSPSGKASRP